MDGYKAILNQEGLPQYHEEKGKDQQPDSKKESVTTKTDEISPSLKVENGKGKVSFFSLRGTTRLLPGEERIPNLPIKETPFFHHSDFTKWANPQNFRVGSQTAGIQEAIDSGAEIIYLPAGHYYFLQTTVIIRNNVRKIFGCEADITPPENRVVFRFDGVKSGMVIIEHIGGGGDVVHNCDQTLVIRKCDLGYRNTIRGTGDVFLEDGMFQRSQVLFPQNFWARQYNSEFGDRAQLTIRHATAWILGIKVEGNRHAIYNLGGTVECYGLYARTGGPVPGVFVENQEGWLAVSLREGGQGTHQIRLKDTWNKESKQVGGPREVGWAILGNPPTPSRNENLPPSPSKLKVQVGERKVNLSWSMEEKSTYPILYYAIYRNGQPWGSTEANQLSYVDEEVQERQQYRYEVRAVDIRGTHSKGAYQEVVIPPDTVPPQFIQALGLSDAPSTIVLDFNEPLLKSTLTQKENYIINPSIPIERITSNYEQTRIILSLFQAMKDGQNYTVTCKNLMDTSQAKNQLGESSKSFIFWEKGDGLKAEFWNGSFEGTPIVTEIHRTINFWWGDSSPHPQLQKDHFSCRWSGYLRPQKTGPHVFFLRVVGQKRLYLDDQLIIDVWGKGPEDVSCKPIELQSDQRYKITIETLHVGTPGGVRFYWRQPGLSENELPKKFNIPREIVNEDFLFTK